MMHWPEQLRIPQIGLIRYCGRPDALPNLGVFHVRDCGLFGHHVAGTNLAMCDGAIHFFSDETAPSVIIALGSRAGGEVMHQTDFVRR
jgi:hypothetical protein